VCAQSNTEDEEVGGAVKSSWWWTRLLPLLLWISIILWVASRPKTTFFSTDMKTILGMPREVLQYPYHFGAFFILAILFRRCLSQPKRGREDGKTIAFLLIGCATVSMVSELLQFYVPTRSPAMRDLAVDQSGAIFAVAVMRHFSEKIFPLGQ
jgi:VanZ like family